MNDKDIELHSGQQIAPFINFRIIKRDAKTGKPKETRTSKNRVTKMALMGIVRMINGEFNQTTPEDMSYYIPKYLALGTNKASTINPGVTTEITVNDSKLLDELSPRILLTQRNIVENIENNPYIKLTIKCYIPESSYVGQSIGEAGLFSRNKGSNCWARISFNPILKIEEEVLDVTWEITILSSGITTYPNKINLFTGDFPITPEGIKFTDTKQRIVLRAEFEPMDSTIKVVKYTSSDPNIAIVDKDSGTISAISNGVCEIIASTTNNLTEYCKVTVEL